MTKIPLIGHRLHVFFNKEISTTPERMVIDAEFNHEEVYGHVAPLKSASKMVSQLATLKEFQEIEKFFWKNNLNLLKSFSILDCCICRLLCLCLSLERRPPSSSVKSCQSPFPCCLPGRLTSAKYWAISPTRSSQVFLQNQQWSQPNSISTS